MTGTSTTVLDFSSVGRLRSRDASSERHRRDDSETQLRRPSSPRGPVHRGSGLGLGLLRPIQRGRTRDAAGLVFFRTLFGVLMAIAVARYFANGWIERYFHEPTYWFTYAGFSWVRPLPAPWMYAYYAAMGLLALLFAFGIAFRGTVWAFGALWTYAHLIDKTLYLNHYYLISLLCLLLGFLPLGRGARTVPAVGHRPASVPGRRRLLLRRHRQARERLARSRRAPRHLAARGRRRPARRATAGSARHGARVQLDRRHLRLDDPVPAPDPARPPLRLRRTGRVSRGHRGALPDRTVSVGHHGSRDGIPAARLASALPAPAPSPSRTRRAPFRRGPRRRSSPTSPSSRSCRCVICSCRATTCGARNPSVGAGR